MISCLCITETSLLAKAELSDLGRVNVICGRNNSGKTTLLKAIHGDAGESRGLAMTDADADAIAERAFQGLGLLDDSVNNPYYQNAARMIIRVAVSNEGVWHFRDAVRFTKSVEVQWNQTVNLRKRPLNINAVANAFKEHFGPAPVVILLPPKRRLDLTAGITTNASPAPTGDGLLNWLFFAKNQPSSSPEAEVYSAIRSAFTQISGGYSFDTYAEAENRVTLWFSLGGASPVKAEDCGLGLQDLLVILYFAIEPKTTLVLIEEPESHLHPDMQRQLLLFMRGREQKQFIVTTHSNIFLNNALIDRVFYVSFSGRVAVDDATSRAWILDDLGYSVAENLVSDLVILVEGPSDVPVIEEFLLKMGVLGRYAIKIWPLGGDIMAQVDLSVFAERYNLAAIVDRDPGSAKVRKKFVEKCEALMIPVTHLKRTAIENYFSVLALREVLKGQIPADFVEIDPKRTLEKQIGINVKNNNRKIARAMHLVDIEKTDLFDFLETIGDLCERETVSTGTS